MHNDACYPALLVIGQFIDALKSGRYDPDRVVLVISQTGGGCRASNYIHLLRKALLRAGFAQGTRRQPQHQQPGAQLRSVPDAGYPDQGGGCLFLRRRADVPVQPGAPYEVCAGDADRLVAHWQSGSFPTFRAAAAAVRA